MQSVYTLDSLRWAACDATCGGQNLASAGQDAASSVPPLLPAGQPPHAPAPCSSGSSAAAALQEEEGKGHEAAASSSVAGMPCRRGTLEMRHVHRNQIPPQQHGSSRGAHDSLCGHFGQQACPSQACPCTARLPQPRLPPPKLVLTIAGVRHARLCDVDGHPHLGQVVDGQQQALRVPAAGGRCSAMCSQCWHHTHVQLAGWAEQQLLQSRQDRAAVPAEEMGYSSRPSTPVLTARRACRS